MKKLKAGLAKYLARTEDYEQSTETRYQPHSGAFLQEMHDGKGEDDWQTGLDVWDEQAHLDAVRAKKKCNFCTKPGHTRETCILLHPELKGRSAKGRLVEDRALKGQSQHNWSKMADVGAHPKGRARVIGPFARGEPPRPFARWTSGSGGVGNSVPNELKIRPCLISTDQHQPEATAQGHPTPLKNPADLSTAAKQATEHMNVPCQSSVKGVIKQGTWRRTVPVTQRNWNAGPAARTYCG